jgi:hypothetical protein
MEAKGLTSGGGDQAASGDVHHELIGLKKVHTKDGEIYFCLEETPGEVAAREAKVGRDVPPTLDGGAGGSAEARAGRRSSGTMRQEAERGAGVDEETPGR